jgi:hypothetical protein
MKRLLLAAGAAFLLGGIAIAQVVVPTVANVGTTDLFADVVNGVPSANTRFATAAAIAGVPGYVNGLAVLTAWTFTFGNTQTTYFIQPAGTLATGTLTTAPNPADGQRECFLSTQTQTALTWSANTGQTMVNAPTAGVAMTPICMTFSLATASWYRSP